MWAPICEQKFNLDECKPDNEAIKFRAFHVGDMQRHTPLKFEWDFLEGDHCDFVYKDDKGEIRYAADTVFCDDDFIKEQFTGKIDRNAVDIYKNDIIAFYVPGMLAEFKGVVKFIRGEWVIKSLLDDFCTLSLYRCNSNMLHVLGNMTENAGYAKRLAKKMQRKKDQLEGK